MVYELHSRLTFSGVLGSLASPYEIWSFRLNMGPVTVGPVAEADLQEAAAAFSTHMTASIRNTARLTEVKHARIGADGKYTDDPDILAVDIPGTASAGVELPPQCALAISLNTDTRGAGGRGRFYLPAPNVGTIVQGRIADVVRQERSTQAAAFLGALNAIGTFANVIVASSKGVNSPVTSVRVGDVVDTIRTRRNAIQEAYTADVTVSQVGA